VRVLLVRLGSVRGGVRLVSFSKRVEGGHTDSATSNSLLIILTPTTSLNKSALILSILSSTAYTSAVLVHGGSGIEWVDSFVQAFSPPRANFLRFGVRPTGSREEVADTV
jgi:hypothetical protein